MTPVYGFDAPTAPQMRRLLRKTAITQPALRQVTLKVDALPNGINLSQGTCQLPVPEVVVAAAQTAMADGHNRYSPADGIAPLRQALTHKLRTFNGIPCEVKNVGVTAGSTGALEAVCDAFLKPGDAVLTFSPFYPYHRKVLEERYGAVVTFAHLRPPLWSFDRDELERVVRAVRPKFILVCNPGNPTGKVFTSDELAFLGELCRRYGTFAVVDEVYEHITFDGRPHVSMAALPDLFEYVITTGSFSKMYAITGWRVGYLCAPESVYPQLRASHDQMFICPNTPSQHGVLAGLEKLGPDHYAAELRAYERKRDILAPALKAAGFTFELPQGAYYIFAGTSERFPGVSSEEMADRLIEKAGIGAVPASDFLGHEVKGDPAKSIYLRFNFALPDELLHRAADRLYGTTLS